MMPKRSYTFNILFISFLVLLLTRIPLFAITKETKRFLGYPRDSLLNFTELTGKYGYSSEEYRVVTEDGYILTAFRIASARNCQGEKRKTSILLMHGLLQSSDSWIDSGPNSGLAYLIADACYDLWLGNTRGNYYSRNHILLDPDRDAAFWQFSVDEIGRYDVPAFIDYVLNTTKADKLNYIGFSQGAGTLFIMCSERPGYCDKVNLAIGLAPAARQTYTSSIYYRSLLKVILGLEGLLTRVGVNEVFSKGAFSQEFVAFFCQLATVTANFCATGMDLFNSMESMHAGSVTNEITRNLFGHFPAGTSLHNMVRYGQAMRTAKFMKFDYGKSNNLDLYGSESPSEYNLSAVTVPVFVIYGKNDGLVDTKDVEWLVSKLPRVLESFLVKDPLWNHLDVTYSQYTGEIIFPKINQYLDKYT